MLGAEYGEPVVSGLSPTEEEFTTRERGVPVLALVQRVDREPAQEAFLRRVRGAWESGQLTADFNDASDVAFVVVRSLMAGARRARPTEPTRPPHGLCSWRAATPVRRCGRSHP